jgi:ubiquinone/menaquinone biosynthesis C-methylase UbiE
MEAEPFYNEFAPKEWQRLERHRTEFAVSLRAMKNYLPKPPGSVLDIGGGPGRYAIELSRQGYSVTLLDISRENLRIASLKAKEAQVFLAGTIHANAVDLGQFDSASCDAVLMMGPLYHLLTHKERSQAVHEAVRVLKPGGRLFTTFITRFAPFRLVASGKPAWLAQNPEYARQLLETGIHDQPNHFAKAYYVHPDEVAPLMESCGLKTLNLIGCEGILAGHEEKVNALTDETWKAWVDLNYKLGQEPTLYGASDHLLHVGEKFTSESKPSHL